MSNFTEARLQFIAALEAKHGCSLEEYITRLETQSRPIDYIPTIKAIASAPLHLRCDEHRREDFVVVVAGVFEKYWSDIMREFPDIKIKWVKPKESIDQIKSKVLQKPVVIDLHGVVNGGVIQAIDCFGKSSLKGHGLNFVRGAIRQILNARPS